MKLEGPEGVKWKLGSAWKNGISCTGDCDSSAKKTIENGNGIKI
jgi:hypothetical protein